jgi:hypothetical protein
MIKHTPIFLIILLCSCVQIDYGYFRYFKEGFNLGNNIDSDQVSSTLNYSFLKASYGRNQAIFVLANISDENIYTWIGANNEVLKTYKGLIVSTGGMIFGNISINRENLFKESKNFYNSDFNLIVNIDSPDIANMQVEYKFLNSSLDKRGCQMITYKKYMPQIKFATKESYCLSGNRVIESTQRFSNLHRQLLIEFHYKY